MSGESSPRQETASDSSTANDKEVSLPSCPECDKSYGATTDLTRHMRSCCPSQLHPCPTCDKRYYSTTGVKQHHSRTHGESIAYTTKDCDYCGEEIEVEDCWMERQEHHFCDRQCSAAWQENRVEIDCEICGGAFEVIKFREDTASCCSHECRIEKTRRITGDERYNYKTRIYECVECGETVERSPSMVYSEDRVFCSDTCFDDFRRTGYSQNYGRNWPEQRRKALRRDQYRCQACRTTHAELDRQPHVHHKQPAKRFKENYPDPEWWKRANRLDNLVSLCASCHRKYEMIAPLFPLFD